MNCILQVEAALKSIAFAPLIELTVRKGIRRLSLANELSNRDDIFSNDFVPCEDSLGKTYRIVRISSVRLYIGASSICVERRGEG